MEIWKSVKGFEGLYEVSNYGRVKSLERKVTTKLGGELPIKERIIKTQNSKLDLSGHLPREKAQLWKNNKTYLKTVGKEVAIAFIENPENKPTVNHKDGNPLNNNVDNLEWNTYSENQLHAYRNGLIKPKKPYIQKTNKSTICKHKDTGKILEFKSIHETARCLKVTVMAVSNCVRENIKRETNKRTCCDYVIEYK